MGFGMHPEGGDLQGDRLGDALEGQIARHGHRCLALELHRGGFKGGGRILRGVQKIRRLDVLVEQG